VLAENAVAVGEPHNASCGTPRVGEITEQPCAVEEGVAFYPAGVWAGRGTWPKYRILRASFVSSGTGRLYPVAAGIDRPKMLGLWS
jgi:hypothetical protein